MFDLISDVERYLEFLPGWDNTRLKREGNLSRRAYLVYSGTNKLSECSNHPNAASFR